MSMLFGGLPANSLQGIACRHDSQQSRACIQNSTSRFRFLFILIFVPNYMTQRALCVTRSCSPWEDTSEYSQSPGTLPGRGGNLMRQSSCASLLHHCLHANEAGHSASSIKGHQEHKPTVAHASMTGSMQGRKQLSGQGSLL